MGSGSTAVTARNLNRNFIGFDISEKYVAIANERIATSTNSAAKPAPIEVLPQEELANHLTALREYAATLGLDFEQALKAYSNS